MKSVNLIFPHQLFKDSVFTESEELCYLVEENLFFKQFNFHKQKIAFHRASMRFYKDYLNDKSLDVHYISSHEAISDIRNLVPFLASKGVKKIAVLDPVDDWLTRRLKKSCLLVDLELQIHESPAFLNQHNPDFLAFFRKDKKKYYHARFYEDSRKKYGILMDSLGKPLGGKWSFDTENRKKYPAKKQAPPIHYPDGNGYYSESIDYVEQYFSNNLGEVTSTPIYPIDFSAAESWLEQFLEYRFTEFGTYEDAIVSQEWLLNHSLLSPLINSGLLDVKMVLERIQVYSQENNIPLNSTEGLVRQIIGWREFIRGMYIQRGRDQRTRNFWEFKRKIPNSFYDGTTGILPIDTTIKRVLKTGYCHHIERLMVLGNFMVLCEFDPDEVYRWFMELFIDAYDWVMVPNVYGMSQFSDGGLMATKPYISSSNYLMKMSNYSKGDWQETWDALFWNFMDKNRAFFLKNPRLGMLIRTFDKFPVSKKTALLEKANQYLETLDKQ